MAKQVTKYEIFLSSPSGIEKDHASVDGAISELNQTFGNHRNLVLELVKWETHTAPGISLDGPQGVINSDIGTDYDLFIGILGTKFGTPTAEAGSGTEEEFLNAYDKYQDSPNSVQILFYFKTAPPKSVFDIDSDQLAKVQRFKESLGTKGILFREYADAGELSKFLRLDIPKRIDQLIDGATEEQKKDTAEVPDVPNTDLGLIDYQELSEDSLQEANGVMNKISDSIELMGNEISKKAEDAKYLASKTRREQKAFFKQTAKILNNFAGQIEPEIEAFSFHFECAFDAFSNMINIQKVDMEGLKQPEIDESHQTLDSLIVGIETTILSMNGLLEGMNSMPRIEKELNRAKRNAETQIRLLISKMESTVELTKAVQQRLQD